MNKPGIYKIINTVNNHFYIGSSNNLKRRKVQSHCTRVEIDGVIYNSQKEAAPCLKLHVTTILRRLKNENYPLYKLIK